MKSINKVLEKWKVLSEESRLGFIKGAFQLDLEGFIAFCRDDKDNECQLRDQQKRKPVTGKAEGLSQNQ